MTLTKTLGCVALALLITACSDSDTTQNTPTSNTTAADTGTETQPDAQTDATTNDTSVAEDTTVADDTAPDAPPFQPETLNDGVVLTLVTLPGADAPVNPVDNTATPPEASHARFVRYTLGEPTATEEREGILVIVPGFLAGAGSFDQIARQLVIVSEGRFEVWAVDRRSNGLEDQRGLDAAEAAKDPTIAASYYFSDGSIDGNTFKGLLTQDELGFMSEWGLEVHMEDLRRILALVPEDKREQHLFLAGHSLGATLVQSYTAFEFEDGHKGHNDVAGLIILDGTVSSLSLADVPDETSYLEGIQGGNPLFGSQAGLDGLRSGDSDVAIRLPLVAPELFITAELAGLRASRYTGNPSGITPDQQVDAFLSITLAGAKPIATHEAILGMAFDSNFQPISFLNANVGTATGGPFSENPSFLNPDAVVLSPSDPDAVYTWVAHNQSDPPEVSDIQHFALSLFTGPSNFAEWYFPARLVLDTSVLGGLVAPEPGDWRLNYGLNTTSAAEMDAPVLAIGAGAGLVPNAQAFEPYKARINPTTREGHDRDDERGFKIIIAPEHAHLDVVLSDNTTAQGNNLFDPILDWMEQINAEGTVPVEIP